MERILESLLANPAIWLIGGVVILALVIGIRGAENAPYIPVEKRDMRNSSILSLPAKKSLPITFVLVIGGLIIGAVLAMMFPSQ